MSLYRWFKTQVYWSIPSIFKNTNPNDFIGDADLVTIYKHTEDSNVYENRKVTLNQLAGLVGGGSQGPVGPMGPQGPAGPAVPSGLKWMGEYNSEASYGLNDVVTWINPDTDVLGSYWVTSEEGVYDVPPTDENGNINEGWAFLASQGAQGIQGVQGEQGPVGPQGPAGTVTFPYIEAVARITFSASPATMVGYKTLVGTISTSKLSSGMYVFTFSDVNDYDGLLSKYIFDIRFSSNSGYVYVPLTYSYSPTQIGLNIYEVNVDTGEYLLADPSDLATIYYRKYN